MTMDNRKINDLVYFESSENETLISRMLKTAIESHDLPSVQSLLEKLGRSGVQDFRDDCNSTFLHYAAKSGDCAINRLLVLAGCPIDETDENGDTALVTAIRYQNFQIAVQLIQDYGAGVNVDTYHGQTPLLCAVTNMNIDFDVSRILLRREIAEQPIETSYMIDSLHLALKARDDEVLQKLQKSETYDSARLSLVKVLLNAGADVNHKDKNGCSPLHCAVYTGDLQLMETLLEAGADIESRNMFGVTALHDAILCHNKEMVHLLLIHDGPSLWACLDVKTVKGNTPLHWAAILNKSYRHADIIRQILEYPVDLDSRNAGGKTPFHLIIKRGGIDLVMDFIARQADIEAVDHTGMNALHYAVHNQDKRVFDVVLKMGSGSAMQKKCDQQGWTALHFASQLLKPDYIRCLIARGADVNATVNISGATPLFLCLNYNLFRSESTTAELYSIDEHMQSINLLLEYGSDINIKIRDPRHGAETTVLQTAIERRDVEDCYLIIEQVAVVEARTNKPMLDDYNLAVINIRKPEIRSYYEKCRAELEAMKNRKIKNTSRTYFAILTEPVQVLARLVRNKTVVEEFLNSDYPSAYPIYRLQLREKFDAAVIKQETLNTACTILCTTLKFGDPSDLFFEIICTYLSEANIKFLIDSARDENVNSHKPFQNEFNL